MIVAKKKSIVSNFVISGFSLQSWKKLRYLQKKDTLPKYATLLLLEQLGVSRYLKERSCNWDHDYDHGWTEGILFVVLLTMVNLYGCVSTYSGQCSNKTTIFPKSEVNFCLILIIFHQ